MNKNIDNILKSISRHKHGLRDPQIMHPEREWLIGISIAVTIFILSGAWSLTLYLKNRNVSSDIQMGEQSEVVVYRESMVNEALGRLDERKAELDALLGKEPIVETSPEEPEEITPPAENESIATSSEETEIETVDGGALEVF
jgi:hypothetical protein